MNKQKFSTFHDADEARLKAWHAPYAALFKGFSPVLDIGCGPGYFQELLRAERIDSRGIDVDPQMVALATQRGNSAEAGDQHTLAKFHDEFMGIHISHVIEHLWGDELILLLQNAVAALKERGLLIIRTPNWGNKKVREFLFWMDHTHKRPYPNELLARIAPDVGLRVITYGNEPFGVEDSYFIAEKPSTSGRSLVVEPCRPVWPEARKQKSLSRKIRNRMNRWLEGPDPW